MLTVVLTVVLIEFTVTVGSAGQWGLSQATTKCEFYIVGAC